MPAEGPLAPIIVCPQEGGEPHMGHLPRSSDKRPVVSESQLMTPPIPPHPVFLAMTAMLAAGDTVVCLTPGYQSLHSIAESIGCRVLPWRARCDAAGVPHRFDMTDLRTLVAAHTAAGGSIAAVVVNFPHNPTGERPCAPSPPPCAFGTLLFFK